MIEIDQHHDSRFCGNAGECDKAYRHGDAEVIAE